MVKFLTAVRIFEYVNIALRRFLHNHGNIATEGSLKPGLCTTLIEWIQEFLIVHSTIDSTAHSRPLNSLEHCIYTTPMTNIRPGRGSNQVLLSFKPQPNRISDGLGPGAVVKAACLKSQRSQVRTPLWPISFIHLTILKRFSWPGLAYICTKMA